MTLQRHSQTAAAESLDRGLAGFRRTAEVPVAPSAHGWFQQSVLLDAARAIATLMMLQGHTLDAVLATETRVGVVFDVWTFLRGLTSCAFLFLSGFVFVFVTDRRQGRRGGALVAADRRLRRFSFFLVLGYALHLPVAKLDLLATMNAEQWRSLLRVDVLQCTAVMLTLLQILALAVRTPRYRAGIVAAIGAMAVLGMPAVWRVDWTSYLPLTVASYLSPATGSLFPLLPWGAFVLLGALVGHLHTRFTAHMGPESLAAFARQVLLPGGALLLVVSEAGWRLPWFPFGPTDFWSNSPSLFCLRAGLVLLLIGALAYVAPRLNRTPFVIQAVARQSLLVYAVHLCIVYGSIWNPGLKSHFGASLPLVSALAVVAGIWIGMAGLAVIWHWSRHHYPRVAWWIRAVTWTVLLGMLI